MNNNIGVRGATCPSVEAKQQCICITCTGKCYVDSCRKRVATGGGLCKDTGVVYCNKYMKPEGLKNS